MQTFKKGEHLTGVKTFESLISQGSSFFLFPFRVVFQLSRREIFSDQPESSLSFPARIGISVSKRKFSSAADRNKIKRLIRESYRKNKETLFYPDLIAHSLTCDLLLIYSHNQILDYGSMEQKTRAVLKKLNHDHIANH